MIRLSWSIEAQGDLAGMNRHIRPDNPVAAQRMLDATFAAAEFLCSQPHAGPAIERTRFRKWRVANTPYILVYRVMSAEIRIVRVVHSEQNWQRFL